MISIVNNIKQLCTENNISIPQLEKRLGFSKGAVYNWDKHSPSIDKVIKVANHFDVLADRILPIQVADLTSYGAALQSIITERQCQDAKWGQQNHDMPYWIGILGEEFGEVCQAVNETVFDNGEAEWAKGGYENMRREAVQVAAVAVAFVEYLDRRYGKSDFEGDDRREI